MTRGRTIILLALLAAAWTTGCGARREFYVDRADIRQSGWDTLHVDVAYAWRAAIGRVHPLVPDTTVVQVFDEAYRLLYRGGPGAIPIPDASLGDRERLLVEVCGRLRGREICVQEQEWASPKRLGVDPDITYPISGDLDRGGYDLDFQIERRRFETDGWEPVDGAPQVGAYLLAWIEGREDDAVKVPLQGRRGRFDLSRHDNYRDFRYHLDARLRAAREASVRFDLYAGVRGKAARLASVEKQVALKTDLERVDEVRFFAERATERLVETLGDDGGRRPVAYVDGWAYQPVARVYRVEMDVVWSGSGRRSDRLEVAGTLEVGEDGAGARFILRRANPEARRRWDRRVGGEVLLLGALEPPDFADGHVDGEAGWR